MQAAGLRRGLAHYLFFNLSKLPVIVLKDTLIAQGKPGSITGIVSKTP